MAGQVRRRALITATDVSCRTGISNSRPFPAATETLPATRDKAFQRVGIDSNTAAETNDYSEGKDFLSAQLIEPRRSYTQPPRSILT